MYVSEPEVSSTHLSWHWQVSASRHWQDKYEFVAGSGSLFAGGETEISDRRDGTDMRGRELAGQVLAAALAADDSRQQRRGLLRRQGQLTETLGHVVLQLLACSTHGRESGSPRPQSVVQHRCQGAMDFDQFTK